MIIKLKVMRFKKLGDGMDVGLVGYTIGSGPKDKSALETFIKKRFPKCKTYLSYITWRDDVYPVLTDSDGQSYSLVAWKEKTE